MSDSQPAPKPDTSLRPALEALSACDDDMAEAFALCGLPPVRSRPQGFAGLIHIITAQQVSVHAARAIIGRLEAAVGSTGAVMTPDRFLKLDEAAFRDIGFSRRKAEYGRGIAEDVLTGRMDFDALAAMDDEDAIAHLVRARGIGRWTAEIYLLFALQRPDVWPVGDLAVQMAVMRLKRMRKKPDEARMQKVGRGWRPHRSAAARFLWHYYHHPGLPD